MVPDKGSSMVSSTAAHDSYVVTALSDITDRALHAALARFTLGLSPAAVAAAYLDWLVHLMAAPGKRLQLLDKMARKTMRLADFASQQMVHPGKAAPAIEPLPQDRRFAGEAWQTVSIHAAPDTGSEHRPLVARMRLRGSDDQS